MMHHHEHDHGPDAPSGPRKPGILLAAFGTAVPEALKAYSVFEAEVREHYPGLPLAWAYTAHKVRRKLASMEQKYDCVATALSRMHDKGVTHLAVQSLHTVPGVEFFWTMNLAKAYEHPRKGFQQVCMGRALLHDNEDLDRALTCLPSYIPKERTPDEAVILVGHGTYHHGQRRYLDFETRIQKADPLLFVGLLMGKPELSSLIVRLNQAGVSTVRLLPFMAVAGHHVRQDIFGADPGSWLNQLRGAGFRVHDHSFGTMDSPCFRAMWLDHLNHAMSGIDGRSPDPG